MIDGAFLYNYGNGSGDPSHEIINEIWDGEFDDFQEFKPNEESHAELVKRLAEYDPQAEVGEIGDYVKFVKKDTNCDFTQVLVIW